MGDGAGHLGRDRTLLGLGPVGLPEQHAISVLDADDGVGLHPGAVAGVGRVGAGEVQRADLLHAQRDRREEVELGVDPCGSGGVSHCGRADQGEELGVDGVDRAGGGFGKGQLAEARTAVVLDGERGAFDVHLDLGGPGEAVAEGGPSLEGGLQHERLERRAWLAAGAAAVHAAHEVHLEGLVVPPADMGPDGAVGVEGDEGGLRPGRIGDDLGHGLLGSGLGIDVEGGDDLEAPPVEGAFADRGHGLLPHPLDEVRGQAAGGGGRDGAVVGLDRDGGRRVGLRLGEDLVVDHVSQDRGASGGGLLEVLHRVGRLRRPQ